LRLDDNRAFCEASGEVLPIFIFDTHILDPLDRDDKRVTFIYQNVLNLKNALRERGLDLAIFYGKPEEIFTSLKNRGFQKVYCSKDFDSYALARDEKIGEILELKEFNDNFIFDKDEILTQKNEPYKVFTPFYKASLKVLTPFHYAKSVDKPKQLSIFDFRIPSLTSLGFIHQTLPDFAVASPKKLLTLFKDKILHYEEDRDFLSLESTSKLGIHLRFGTIGIREVLRILKNWQEEGLKVSPFYRELIWREFWNYLLIHFPHSEKENFLKIDPKWRDDRCDFEAWCEGRTGVPIVDAGMRELNKTGYMHNRARMITASFLTKNLLLPWQWGEEYFAKKLLDFEKSTNVGSWQWAASSGADAQPYFRIFNPYLQTKRFDSECSYIKKWIPELREVPKMAICNEEKLVTLNIKGYPKPMVDIKTSSQIAKAAFR